MRKSDKGFAILEGLLIVVVIALVVGVGYIAMKHRKNTTTASTSASLSTQSQTPTNQGTTASVESLGVQEVSTENSLLSQYTSNDQSAANGTNSTTSGIGGAYNVASL